MKRLMFLGLGLLVASPALAQTLDFKIYDPDKDGNTNWLLDFEDVAGFSRSGAGSPTVAWDGSQYVMYFETRFIEDAITGFGATDGHEVCRNNPVKDRVVWGIGRATSPDGLTWTADSQPVLVPKEDTFYACQAAHPNVIYDAESGTWHMWFKAVQGWERHLCLDGEPESPWGCKRWTGVGYATSSDGVSWTVPGTDPVLPVGDDFGFPTVTRVSLSGETDPTWYMYVAKNPEIYRASSADPDTGWDFYTGGGTEPAAVMSGGAAEWIDDVVFNPGIICEEPEKTFPFTLVMGGRALAPEDYKTILNAGWGKASSLDGVDFFTSLDSPYFEWSGTESWRHWEPMRVDSHYVIWYSEKDDAGKLRVSFTYSMDDPAWSSTDVNPRICDAPDTDTDTGTETDTGSGTGTGSETGTGTETDTETDTETETETETESGGGPVTKDGCNCSSTSSTPFALIWPLALMGLAFRRRRS